VKSLSLCAMSLLPSLLNYNALSDFIGRLEWPGLPEDSKPGLAWSACIMLIYNTQCCSLASFVVYSQSSYSNKHANTMNSNTSLPNDGISQTLSPLLFSIIILLAHASRWPELITAHRQVAVTGGNYFGSPL